VPFVAHSGLDLHVQVLGDEGPPLVMLHGFLVGSMATWYFGAAPKLARRFNVVLADLRGHGLSSPAPSGYDLTTLAGDLHAQVPLAGSGSVSLVGHSYGALVAMRYAIDHPGHVRQLVLVDCPLPSARVPDLEAFFAQSPETLLASLPPQLQDNITNGGRQGRRLLAQLERLIHQSTLLADIAREPVFTDAELASLDIPALLVYGDRSGCRPAGELLARALPRARLRILPGGHFLPSDQPTLLANLLEEELYHG
jgi:pimeloyl-ACP methyl ester carboxylesterase